MVILQFIIIIGVLVLFHEFGHFAVAKLNQVKVHEFSIGMGPKLLSKQGKETLYSLRLLPIGGYVKMEGEDEESDDPRGFNKKKPYQKLSILFAGPFMNFVLAALLFIIIFASFGVHSSEVTGIVDDSPAMISGIIEGDVIKSIDGKTIMSKEQLTQIITSSDGDPLEFGIKRDGESINLVISPYLKDERFMIGAIFGKRDKNPIKVVSYSFYRTGEITKMIIEFIPSLFTNKEAMKDVVGPVGMVDLVGQASSYGILAVLELAALISINLGIMNLLPFPALDGGRIIFILVAIIIRRPINEKIEGTIHAIGFILLMTLMFFVLYRDVIRIAT